jgi:hypothetical protein
VIQEARVECVSCGEPFGLTVDTTGGREQRYIEDCPVCCRPMDIRVRCRPGEVLGVEVSAA